MTTYIFLNLRSARPALPAGISQRPCSNSRVLAVNDMLPETAIVHGQAINRAQALRCLLDKRRRAII
jgi:hypothetical protein